MQTQSSQKDIVEFLIADFSDTSEHLQVTGRKIEFTFQLYAGFLSLLITLAISLLTINPNVVGDILVNLRIFYGIVSGILIILGALTWWVFEFSLRGSKMNGLYINRMNYLRSKIYQALGEKTYELDGFAYVSQLLPKTKASKVGMTDLFPLALQSIFSFFIFPAFWVCVYLVFDPYCLWVQTNMVFAILLGLSVIIFGYVVFALFERHWERVINDTDRIIKINWRSLIGESK